MAKASIHVIKTLKNTAFKIQQSEEYQWGHMGSCNCGFLVQEITQLRKDEIHTRAMLGHGDWSEQLNDYCPTSGLLMDDLITEMLSAGFDSDDLKNLERLSDKKILNKLPEINLKHNNKQDVVTYLLTWVEVLEEEMFQNRNIVLESNC